MRRGFPRTARRVVRRLGAAASAAVAAALHHTAAVTAATAAAVAYGPGDQTADGRELVAAAAATQRRGRESPYKGRSAYGFFDVGENCTESPLWDKEVDAASYELGCEEIEVRVCG